MRAVCVDGDVGRGNGVSSGCCSDVSGAPDLLPNVPGILAFGVLVREVWFLGCACGKLSRR